MVLEVQSVGGQRLELEAVVGQQIADLKKQIEEHWGYPVTCQRLLKESAEITDTYCLEEKDLNLELICLISLQKLCLQLSSRASMVRSGALKQLRRLRGQPAALQAAKQCLEDVNAYVRSVAVEAILQVAEPGDPEAIAVAEEMLKTRPVLGLQLLEALSPEAADLQRLRFLDSQDVELRRSALRALKPGHRKLLPTLKLLLQDPDRDGFENVRLLALVAIQGLCPLSQQDLEALDLLPHVADPNAYIREAAADVLLRAETRSPLPVMSQLFLYLEASKCPDVRASLLSVMIELVKLVDEPKEQEDVVLLLLRLLIDPDPDLQHAAARAIQQLPGIAPSELDSQSGQKACLEVWKSTVGWLESRGRMPCGSESDIPATLLPSTLQPSAAHACRVQ